jgi:hypothetical protein
MRGNAGRARSVPCIRCCRHFLNRHISVDALRGYLRDAELFKDRAGAGLL